MPIGRPIVLGKAIRETIWLDSVDSTNAYISSLPEPESSRVVATWNQTAGRGRLDRRWVSPKGKSLAFSLELWRDLVPAKLNSPWLASLSLLAGATLADSIGRHTCLTPRLKWPNDVLLGGQKVAGIIGELPAPGRVIVGIGLNVYPSEKELSTFSSTSLADHGVGDLASLALILESFFVELHVALKSSRNGLAAQGRQRILDHLDTIGQIVRIEYPDGSSRTGEAVGLDESGRLRVLFLDCGEIESIDSADVWHLRSAR